VLDPSEARALLDSIDTSTVVGLRDRALIGLMVYSFARIGAALGMTVEDVFTQNRRLWVRLREKGGKRHSMPCHHYFEEYIAGYLDGAGLRGDPKGPLFGTIGRGTGKLTRRVLPQASAYAMIGRRATGTGIATKLGNHSFRATGITAYLKNGGTLEKAAAMANHASTRTTQLYDRQRDELSLDEVERIVMRRLGNNSLPPSPIFHGHITSSGKLMTVSIWRLGTSTNRKIFWPPFCSSALTRPIGRLARRPRQGNYPKALCCVDLPLSTLDMPCTSPGTPV
jgi:hypothetical protein